MRTQSTLGKISGITHEQSFGVAYIAMRLALGGLFLTSGWSKITTGWSAASYLAVSTGPFAEWFQALAGSNAIDALNAWGLFLLGIALLSGFLIRPAAILGVLLMVLYYFAHFTENTAYGFIDQHIVYATVLALFAAGGAGHAFGLNSIVLDNIRKPKAIMKFLFG